MFVILQCPIFCLLNRPLELDGPTPTLHQTTILEMSGQVKLSPSFGHHTPSWLAEHGELTVFSSTMQLMICTNLCWDGIRSFLSTDQEAYFFLERAMQVRKYFRFYFTNPCFNHHSFMLINFVLSIMQGIIYRNSPTFFSRITRNQRVLSSISRELL